MQRSDVVTPVGFHTQRGLSDGGYRHVDFIASSGGNVAAAAAAPTSQVTSPPPGFGYRHVDFNASSTAPAQPPAYKPQSAAPAPTTAAPVVVRQVYSVQTGGAAPPSGPSGGASAAIVSNAVASQQLKEAKRASTASPQKQLYQQQQQQPKKPMEILSGDALRDFFPEFDSVVQGTPTPLSQSMSKSYHEQAQAASVKPPRQPQPQQQRPPINPYQAYAEQQHHVPPTRRTQVQQQVRRTASGGRSDYNNRPQVQMRQRGATTQVTQRPRSVAGALSPDDVDLFYFDPRTGSVKQLGQPQGGSQTLPRNAGRPRVQQQGSLESAIPQRQAKLRQTRDDTALGALRMRPVHVEPRQYSPAVGIQNATVAIARESGQIQTTAATMTSNAPPQPQQQPLAIATEPIQQQQVVSPPAAAVSPPQQQQPLLQQQPILPPAAQQSSGQTSSYAAELLLASSVPQPWKVQGPVKASHVQAPVSVAGSFAAPVAQAQAQPSATQHVAAPAAAFAPAPAEPAAAAFPLFETPKPFQAVAAPVDAFQPQPQQPVQPQLQQFEPPQQPSPPKQRTSKWVARDQPQDIIALSSPGRDPAVEVIKPPGVRNVAQFFESLEEQQQVPHEPLHGSQRPIQVTTDESLAGQPTAAPRGTKPASRVKPVQIHSGRPVSPPGRHTGHHRVLIDSSASIVEDDSQLVAGTVDKKLVEVEVSTSADRNSLPPADVVGQDRLMRFLFGGGDTHASLSEKLGFVFDQETAVAAPPSIVDADGENRLLFFLFGSDGKDDRDTVDRLVALIFGPESGASDEQAQARIVRFLAAGSEAPVSVNDESIKAQLAYIVGDVALPATDRRSQLRLLKFLFGASSGSIPVAARERLLNFVFSPADKEPLSNQKAEDRLMKYCLEMPDSDEIDDDAKNSLLDFVFDVAEPPAAAAPQPAAVAAPPKPPKAEKPVIPDGGKLMQFLFGSGQSVEKETTDSLLAYIFDEKSSEEPAAEQHAQVRLMKFLFGTADGGALKADARDQLLNFVFDDGTSGPSSDQVAEERLMKFLAGPDGTSTIDNKTKANLLDFVFAQTSKAGETKVKPDIPVVAPSAGSRLMRFLFGSGDATGQVETQTLLDYIFGPEGQQEPAGEKRSQLRLMKFLFGSDGATNLTEESKNQLLDFVFAGESPIEDEIAEERLGRFLFADQVAAEYGSEADRQAILDFVVDGAGAQGTSEGHASSGGSAEPPQQVLLYDDVLNGPLAEFVALCTKIGGDVEKLGAMTKSAFATQREFLWTACSRAKPADSELSQLLAPTSKAIEALVEFRNNHLRSDTYFNHLSAVSESIQALSWVIISPAPAPHIKEMGDAAMFYTNRVLKDYKEKDETHVKCVRAWLRTLTELQAYVKQNHTTGLVWNTAPGNTPPASGKAPSPPKTTAAPGAPAPPPPPPPPPPPVFDTGSGDSKGDADARAALFADINRGLDVTKGLKKVSDDQKTHKNPELRAGAAVPAKAAAANGKPQVAPKPAGLSQAAAPHPPKCELEGGKKWIVEYQKNNNQLVIDDTKMSQVIYLYKCENSVVVVKGKVNSITMDSCKKCSIVFDALVSQLEIINSQSAQVQTFGAMPTLCIQKTDGCQVYLSKESLQTEIVTSKSSEMNILIPDANGEFSEHPLPEQYKSQWDGKKIVTTVVDIA